MFDMFCNVLDKLFGLNEIPQNLTIGQITLRCFFVYLMGIAIIVNTKRFVAFQTSLDFIIRIIIGTLLGTSLLSPINFFKPIIIALILVAFYWVLALLTYHIPFLERVLKGTKDVLIKDGEINWRAMRRNFITKDDLMDALHAKSNLLDVRQVKLAFFEKNGDITIFPKDEFK